MSCQQVLVVEADYGLRRVLTRFLEAKGYTVSAIATPGEALELLRHYPDFGFVRLDLQLENGLNGEQILAQLAWLGAFLPAIVVSSSPQRLLRQPQPQAVETRPFSFSQLILDVENGCFSPVMEYNFVAHVA